jgi:hypothetical protein
MKFRVKFNFWPTFNHKVLYFLSLILQGSASVLYGLRLLNEYGTDYGIYYAGSVATRQNDYGLYSNFFEIKGPLYYGFLKLLSFFINYSLTGAVIELILTAFFWFLCVNIACRLISSKLHLLTIAAITSVALLVGQDSNSSMSLFQGGLVALSLALIYKYLVTYNITFFYLSIAASTLACLVKLDSFGLIIIIPLLYLFCSKIRSVFQLILGFVFFMFFYMTILLFLSQFLNFSLSNYFYQAFQFVIETRWNLGESKSHYGILGIFVRDYYSITLLLATGILFSLLIAYQNTSFRNLIKDPGFIIIIYGSISYLVLESDKNYHLLVLYSSLLVALVIKIENELIFNRLKVITVTSLLSASLVIANFSVDSRCVITNNIQCLNRFEDLLQPNQDKGLLQKSFYLNQGWPFIINGVLPKINFTVWWPLAFNVKYSTNQVIDEANTSNFPIWVDYNDFIDLQKRNPIQVSEFMKGKKLVRNDLDSKWAELVPIK